MTKKNDVSSKNTSVNDSVGAARATAAEAKPGPSTTQTKEEPGGLFGYIQRKTANPNRAASRMQYHKLANIGASNYLLDTSDSDDDEPIIARENAASPPPIFDTPSIDAKSTSESWLSRFQKSADDSNPLKKHIIEREEPLSWMSQALTTMDNAKQNASDWISTQTNTTSDWASSLSSYLPSTAWSPFSKENNILPTSSDDASDHNNTLAFLPKMAARISFATKTRNPYQAVIGRDTDYLLSSNTAYFWGLGNGTSWFSWFRNKTLRLIEATDEHGILQKALERPKSQPSEASIQAVKNLLDLVQTETLELQLNRQLTNFSDASSHSSLEVPFHSPLEGFPDIHPPKDSVYHTPRKGSAEDNHSQQYQHNLSFESCSSYASQYSQVRSSPVRGAPGIDGSGENHGLRNNANNARNAEMASRLAEGTLRAYRDLVLDEAVELHSALHYWTLRWERPFLGWLEAGPSVWMSESGHSPYEAARKMSQIQAVLARRCASIGEIQQHLWRATWTKGVANWGMLGTLTGGEWVSVVGGDGALDDAGFSKRNSLKGRPIQIFHHPSLVGSNVMNAPGGRIVIDDDAQVIWSIDAMRVVRDQLYRASLGVEALPHVQHWPREAKHFGCEGNDISDGTDLPVWAGVSHSIDAARAASNAVVESSKSLEGIQSQTDGPATIITDLPKMSEEVASLLEAIEINLYQQRNRRLEKLRPPNRWRRNWYVLAIGIPAAMYIGHKLTKEHGGFFLLKQVFKKVADLCRDHVTEPLHSIYQELVKGRLDVTDRKARLDAIESLKRMIRSWLDENYPKMNPADRAARAEAMDISLIEQHMEESIKYIYEAPALVRMSLIEMQFIKKELLNALVAMDELMGSNEMNMQIAAMTPAVILLMAVRRTFLWLFYYIFREGRSRDDVYATVRQTILDIERLLVMRDSPPPPPDSLDWGSHQPELPLSTLADRKEAQTLSTDDLGMLLLHIHECRQIIWQNRRRFRGGLLRNLTEDLAELAGERGPVSLKQQLQIVNRMSKVYLFMKPRSTFVTKI